MRESLQKFDDRSSPDQNQRIALGVFTRLLPKALESLNKAERKTGFLQTTTLTHDSLVHAVEMAMQNIELDKAVRDRVYGMLMTKLETDLAGRTETAIEKRAAILKDAAEHERTFGPGETD